MSDTQTMATPNLAAEEPSKPQNIAPKTELKPAYLDVLNKVQENKALASAGNASVHDTTPKTVPNQMTQAFLNAQIATPKTQLHPTPTANPAPATATSVAPQASTPLQKPTTMSRVDLSIAGTPHRISCPADEVENLKKTADTLNKNLKELRSAVGKNPSNEELLVLHCLELYDQIRELTQTCNHYKRQEQEVGKQLDILLKNAQMIG